MSSLAFRVTAALSRARRAKAEASRAQWPELHTPYTVDSRLRLVEPVRVLDADLNTVPRLGVRIAGFDGPGAA